MSATVNPVQLPLAPAWAQRFRSDDLDEVRAFMRRMSGEHSRVAHRVGRIGFEQAWLSGEAATVGWAQWAVPKTVRGAVMQPTLHLMAPLGSEYRVGRRISSIGAATATFLAPGWEFTRRSPPGDAFALSVDGRRLAEAIDARRPGGRAGVLFRTRSIEYDSLEQARIVSAADEVIRASAPTAESLRARAESRLIDVVADLLLRREAAPRAGDLASARIADLEAWIDSHLEEPLTIDRLCHVAGVGERCLQKAFESRRGMSPMRFVTERRLAEARRRLEGGAPRNDVTHVALGLGFHHMGRFASLYRDAFGETPSRSRSRSVPPG